MEQFARALEILEKTDDGIDEIQSQIDTEISSIVNRETTQVSDRSFSETDVKPESQLLLLLENLIFQFRNVAKMHQRLLTSVKKSNYKAEEVWFKIQNILKLLLRLVFKLHVIINGFKFFNPKVSRAPLSCGDHCFRVIRDLSDYISLPEE